LGQILASAVRDANTNLAGLGYGVKLMPLSMTVEHLDRYTNRQTDRQTDRDSNGCWNCMRMKRIKTFEIFINRGANTRESWFLRTLWFKWEFCML